MTTEPDVPGDRQVQRAREAAAHVVVARLQAVAVVVRALERRRVELAVLVAAAAAPGSPTMRTRPRVVGRAGDVHVAAAARVAVGDGVGAPRSRRSTRPRAASR